MLNFSEMTVTKICHKSLEGDMRNFIDCNAPLIAHEMFANMAYSIKVQTQFSAHFFVGKTYLFVEPRFIKVAQDSRDILCNRYKVPHQDWIILPTNTDEDATYAPQNAFSERLWELVKEANPHINCASTPHEHPLIINHRTAQHEPTDGCTPL